MTPPSPLHSPTAPLSVSPPPTLAVPSWRGWTGWAGVVAVVLWLGFAGWSSTTVIESITGPIPFVWVGLALLGVMGRWPPPPTSSPFARAGGVVLLAWLLSSFAGAWTTNWGQDPWLIEIIQTFQHGDHLARFVVVAAAIASLASVSRRRELWLLGPLMVAASVAAVTLHLPSAVVGGGVWWAGRALRGVATRRFTATIALLTFLGAAPDAASVICGWGGSYGSIPFVLFADPRGGLVCAVAMIGLATAGGVALRRRRLARAGRLWAAAIGCGAVVVGYVVLGGCSGMGPGVGPLLLVLAAGPRIRWSTLLWGIASTLAAGVIIAVRYGSAEHVVADGIMVGAATVAFALIHRAVRARRLVASS